MVRSPMQVDEDFRKRMKKIQEGIMRNQGEFRSIPKITHDVLNLPEWNEIEKKLLLKNNDTLDIKIKFDGRFIR